MSRGITKTDLDNDVVKLACNLYANLNLNKSDINMIFVTLLLTNTFLFDKMNKNLNNAISKEASDNISKIFIKYNDPLDMISTSYKRQALFEKVGLYARPEEYTIGVKDIPEKTIFLSP